MYWTSSIPFPETMLIAAKYAKPRRSPPEQACKASVQRRYETSRIGPSLWNYVWYSCETNAKPVRSLRICEACGACGAYEANAKSIFLVFEAREANTKPKWSQCESKVKPMRNQSEANVKSIISLQSQCEANEKLMQSLPMISLRS